MHGLRGAPLHGLARRVTPCPSNAQPPFSRHAEPTQATLPATWHHPHTVPPEQLALWPARVAPLLIAPSALYLRSCCSLIAPQRLSLHTTSLVPLSSPSTLAHCTTSTCTACSPARTHGCRRTLTVASPWHVCKDLYHSASMTLPVGSDWPFRRGPPAGFEV